MGFCCDCFGGGDSRMTKEEERLASEEARARAAEAAQKRFTLLPFVNIKIPFFILSSSALEYPMNMILTHWIGFLFRYPHGFFKAWSLYYCRLICFCYHYHLLSLDTHMHMKHVSSAFVFFLVLYPSRNIVNPYLKKKLNFGNYCLNFNSILIYCFIQFLGHNSCL